MNFGPLSKEGGERRLNVLITRAKLRCVVYSQLTHQDIDTRKTEARGTIALKRFLKYAETKELDMPVETGREADSPFEREVAKALHQAGFEVEHQVGSGGFFIEL